MTQEFHISVTPVGNDEYLVRTERVEPGVPLAEEQLVWTVDDWLAQARYLMNDPLLGLLQNSPNRIGGFELPPSFLENSVSPDTPPTTLIELGQRLYHALFQGTLRDSWMTAKGIAQHRGEVLRLRLGLKGSKLPRLPWEVLNAGDFPRDVKVDRDSLGPLPRPIATGTDILFSRHYLNTGMMGTPQPFTVEQGQPVRILMVIAAPTDQEQLELHREALHLKRELSHPRPTGGEPISNNLPDLHLTLLEQPGREELTQALEQGSYHVLHYAGHSNLDAAGGALYLVNPRTGLTETLSGDDLAGLLVNNGIRMAVFNSCRGAHTASYPEENEERNLAEALVSREIPAVLAMAEKIPDDVALTLTRLFYRNLKQGYPLDLALSRARQGLLSAYSSHQLYWALPILYLHPECDGYLTAGDRTLDNPADRSLPRPYEHPPLLSGETWATNAPAEVATAFDSDLDMIHRAVLQEESMSVGGRAALKPIPWDTSLTASLDDLSDEPDNSMVELLHELSPRANATAALLRSERPKLQTQTLAGNSQQQAPPYPLEINPAPQEAISATMLPQSRSVAEAPSHSSAPVSTASSTEAPARRAIDKKYLVLPLLGAGVMAIALAVLNPGLFNLRLPSGRVPAQPQTTLPQNLNQVDPQTADNATLTGAAALAFGQSGLNQGEQAVAELLNRGALQEAKAALDAVPTNEREEASINFLFGRLAWQAVQQGNSDFSQDDVLRFWKTAVEREPGSTEFNNALGFAYLQNNQLAEAIQSFCKTISLDTSLANGESAAPAEAGANSLNCPMPTQAIAKADTLTAYAGIALALQQAAISPNFKNPTDLANRALALHQAVMLSAPGDFLPNALSKNWLWTEEMVQHWQGLNTLNVERAGS